MDDSVEFSLRKNALNRGAIPGIPFDDPHIPAKASHIGAFDRWIQVVIEFIQHGDDRALGEEPPYGNQ